MEFLHNDHATDAAIDLFAISTSRKGVGVPTTSVGASILVIQHCEDLYSVKSAIPQLTAPNRFILCQS